MQTCSRIKSLLFLLLLLFTSLGYAQLSKKHYIPPLTAGPPNANPEDQHIYISTPSNSLVPYTIIPIGQPTANYINGTVSNATPQIETITGTGDNTQLFIPSGSTSTIVNNKGYIIEAQAPIYVSVRMNAGQAQAGALVSKGASALDTTFRIGTYTSESPQTNYVSFASVMATEDDTTVNFSDFPAGLIIENYTGTTPFSVTLDEGESYTISINVADNGPGVNNLMDGLIGGLVTSDKPIVVSCGSANGSFHNGMGRDYGIDQIAGLSKVGNEYIFVRGDGPDTWENVLIVAHTNGTTISINGSPTGITLNAGEYHVIEGNNYSANNNMYVQTSESVFAYQGVGSTSEANQGMFFVPPLSCETRGNIDNIANIDRIGNLIYSGGVTIVTKTGANVTVNNQPLSSFATVGPSAVLGKTDYETYRITGLTGNVSVQGDDELYVAYFNVSGAATSGSFYSGFPSNPEINFDLQFTALGNCIPNVTLEAANAQNFDTYEWFYDDGSGFVSLAQNVVSITPTIPARYKLIGTITCTGETLESVEVPVSICPDDIDNDGIIDNIDIDNDNDGIENCYESQGNVTLDITNENSPELVFQDNSRNTTIASAVYTETSSSSNTNTFTGDNQGNFTSIVGNAASAEGDYTVSFTEPVNIKLTESTILNTSTLGEVFVVRIAPSNKNITLIDPDDRLLVDSNFDDLFETGITQISGSEIHFRINPMPNGNTPFQFLANSVEGFSFIHRLQNATDPSTFSANLSLTCFKKDTDNDGIKDELDLDSDNDGIPDSIERTGTILALTGVDADNNGLDDVYNGLGDPIDTDNDGVVDFYDLDSDNDGIYDFLETRDLAAGLDADNDGMIDTSNAYGLNGWADAAETTADSNTIGYTLNDEDGDTIFSYIDHDSDGDLCFDVIEAGYTDDDNDGYLGISPVTVNANGVVTGAGGYTANPDADYMTGAPISITTQPVDPSIVCENSDIDISVISPEAEDYQWEVLTSPTGTWTALVETDPNYTNVDTATLTINATPLSFNNYQYRVKLDRAGNSCGLYSDAATLTVNVLPVANTANTMRLCDDNNDGEMTFDLSLQTNDINSTSGFTVTYHTSLSEAETNSNAITSILTGNRIIWARVENDANTSCYDISIFDLEVYESPTPLLTVDAIRECDDTSFGTDIDGRKIFDLTQRENDILNGQSAADFALTYFTDSGFTNQIPDPANYLNTNRQETIYVRMTNNAYNVCIEDTSFDIEVYELPVVNIPGTYAQCDDSSNDQEASFNLTLDWIKEDININYASLGLIFRYYDDPVAANSLSGNGELINPDSYLVNLSPTGTGTVWIRVETPNSCFRTVPLTLEVNISSTALDSYNPSPLYQCDETGRDNRNRISTFDLTNIQNDVLTIFTGFNVTVHFFESQSDAELETNEIPNIAAHRNTNSPGVQSIWVRVKSNLNNDCLGLKEFTNLLNVEDLPFANAVTFNERCDHDTSDTVINFPFNTSRLESDILNGQTPSSVTISYFDTQGTPLDRSDDTPLLYADGRPVVSPIENQYLTTTKDIIVEVTNNATQDPDGPCSDFTTISFVVHQQPVIADNIAPQIECDGDHPDDLDDRDGYFPFDTSNFASTILGTQAGTMEIYFSYVDENDILQRDVSAIDLPNILLSRNQTISVRVENPNFRDCSVPTSIDLVVNERPEFYLQTEELFCGNPFDPFDIVPSITSSFDPYSYTWTHENGTEVAYTSTLTRATILANGPGEYTLTVTNDNTTCNRSATIDIKSADPPNITEAHILRDDFRDNNTVTIDDYLNLGNSTYEFSIVNQETGLVEFPYQEAPVFNDVRPGFYILRARDIEQVCDVVEVPFSVIGYMKFFTPNNDTYHDTWKIIGVNEDFQPTSRILIFDRYGKLLKQISTLQDGWDGRSRGTMMPTDDYWFKLFLEDGRVYTGHFTLKR